MRISTTLGRWLGIFVLFACLTGTAFAQRNVTLKLNTATLPDTLDAMDEIQVRGAVDGTGNVALPDGNVIDWNDNTTLKPVNMGGDNWMVQFQIPDNAELKFKFYSQLAEDDAVGGWEDGDDHAIPAGTGNVDLGTHFFVKGAGQAYDWRPFEDKQDSVAVWFRVYMNTESSIPAGYKRDGTDVVGLRGDPLGGAGPLDWGATLVTLTRESDDDTRPGYDLYSGVAYYPTSAAGMVQPYKHFVNPSGWEDGINDRTFTVPAQDTTLHWVYFGNTAPIKGEGPQSATVIYSVDVTPLAQIGLFDRARGDTLQVRGGFNGWGCDNPDNCLMQRFPGTNVFEVSALVTLIPETEVQYKFFIDFNNQPFEAEFGQLPPSGWEEPISTTGANRSMIFGGNPNVDQFLGDQRFNDVFEENIIAAGNTVNVNFSVNMEPAKSAAEPFDPAIHSVYVEMNGDALWAFTQNIPRDNDGNFIIDETFTLEDPDGDGVFSGAFPVTGPTYSGIQYKFAYGVPGSGAYLAEVGGSTTAVGRRRTRFIRPNSDGTWPSNFSFVQETYQPEGNLPFEQNPATSTAVEPVDGELPTQIALSQNFPNPFNPSTTFEYSIDRTMEVKVRIYDMLGRVVATLVDGLQTASTYQVSFDASMFASGTYMYRLETPSQIVTRKMILVK